MESEDTVTVANLAAGAKGYGPRLRDWLKERRPDIVTLQKTGSNLPAEDLHKLGYETEVLTNPRPYLGVAVLSRRDLPHKPVVQARDLLGAKGESRFLTVDIGGLQVSSVYAPYCSKSARKQAIEKRIAWLNRLRDHVESQGYTRQDSLLCGDFNAKFRADQPYTGTYTKAVEEALQQILELGFIDLYRQAHPDPNAQPGRTRGYSEKRPHGTSRLQLVLASVGLAPRLRSAWVDLDSTPWPREDAPPLVVELDGATDQSR